MKYKSFPALLILSVLFIFAGLLKQLFADSIDAITVAGITDKFPLEYITAASLPDGAYVELWKLWSKKQVLL